MMSKLSIKPLIALVAVIAALMLVIFPIDAQPVNFSYSAALVLVTLVGWSTGLFPPFLTALVFFALAMIFNLVDPALLFAGFGSTAVWLIISGFIIGAAITATGLGKKLASLIAPHLTGSYFRLIFGLVFSSALLGFVMPSSVGRAVVLIPIGMALADQVGFGKGSNGRIGIATSLALACNMPSFAVLPANIPNMILAGASETLFDVTFSYTEYLFLHFPVLGILKSLLIVAMTLKIFPDEISTESANTGSDEHAEEIDMSAKQIKVGIILGITLLLWVTDTIHGVNPAWVGLAAAVILLLPKWGVVAPKAFNSSVDFGTVVFVSSALGLGALVNESGIGSSMGDVFTMMIPSGGHDFLSFMALSIISTLTGLVATIPGVPTVLTPMAAEFAQATGFSIPAVLMTQVIGFSTVLFPYQVAPLIIAMQLSNEPLSKLVKLTLPLTVATVLVLMPLDYLWWVMLGWIG